MKKQTNCEEIKKIKEMLPKTGAYKLIAGMINGAYSQHTIRAMLTQKRKMHPVVLDAAKCVAGISQQSLNAPTNQQGYNRQIKIVIPSNTIENETND